MLSQPMQAPRSARPNRLSPVRGAGVAASERNNYLTVVESQRRDVNCSFRAKDLGGREQ